MTREIRNLSGWVPREILALSNQELRSLAYVSVPILESGRLRIALLHGPGAPAITPWSSHG